ncbi:MAG: hypothetical protein L6V83_03240 [Christensenella sp.]|nr:MAG: hypothetical protein L6V83_03240 [Christensenella sp.]
MKRTKIVLALLLLAVMLTSSFALVACDKVPEKYKMKNFYGSYDQFANDYYNVIFSFNGNRYNNDLTTGWWNICELKENSFVYIDTTGEKKEQECDAVLIAKIRELQQQIGRKVVIEKKKITFVDSNTVLKAEKTVTKFNGHYYYSAMYDSDGDNLFDGHYENENTENERKIITVVAKNTINIQGDEWYISIAKSFI